MFDTLQDMDSKHILPLDDVVVRVLDWMLIGTIVGPLERGDDGYWLLSCELFEESRFLVDGRHSVLLRVSGGAAMLRVDKRGWGRTKAFYRARLHNSQMKERILVP